MQKVEFQKEYLKIFSLNFNYNKKEEKVKIFSPDYPQFNRAFYTFLCYN